MSQISKKQQLQIVISFVLLGIMFLTSSYLYFNSIVQSIPFENESNNILLNSDFWDYYKITPSENGDSTKIILQNNKGEIKEVPELSAYGLSNKKKLIGGIVKQSFIVYDLDNDFPIQIDTGLENFRFNFGNSIRWSFDDNFAAISILDLDSNSTKILLFNIKETNSKTIPADIPFDNEKIEPTYFSSISEKLIVRSYNKLDLEFPNEDGSLPSTYQVPAYLSIYNYTNIELLSKLMVLEFPQDKFIDYGFDFSGLTKYFISNKKITELVPDYKYTKIAI